MIASADGRVVLSSMGWVDGDSLWRFDVTTGRVQTIRLGSGARYVTVHAGDGDGFAVAHHFDGRRFEVTVRTFGDPSIALARSAIGPEGKTLDGDPALWAGVRRLYVEYLALPPWGDFVLVTLTPAIEIQELAWYDDSYDKGYQGVIDALELPDRKSALISVQRSSRLILHDLETGARRRAIDLGGHTGNPALHYRRATREIWTTDYDALAVVDAGAWSVKRRARLQGAAGNVQQFIGDLAFPPDADLCVVARPFSGDVVAVDCETLRIRASATLGAQPLKVAALAGGEIVARDWKTGSLLRGRLGA